MAIITTELITLLRGVVSAGRDALADRDGPQIPAKLAKVAQSSARSLPPPLARSLLTVIDEDEVFRSEVADKLGEDDEIALAFVERPDGWWALIATALADKTQSASAAKVSAATSEAARQERFAAEAAARLEEAIAAADVARSEAQQRIERLQRRHDDTAASGALQEPAADGRELAAVQDRLIAAETTAAEAKHTIDALRTRVRKLRRPKQSDDGAVRGSLPTEPIELARTLDLQVEVASRLSPGGAAQPEPPDEPGESFALAPGVAPDSADALAWLMSAPAATVIIDGYNVLFRSEGHGFDSGAGRRKLDQAMRLMHRQSASGHSVVVVYDSSVAGERVPSVRSGGLEVRFAPCDRLADEEIADLAAAVDGNVVVVSSDREVREHAEAVGAVVLWSEALVGLLRG
ncbi:MAG: NYN domain-containing protein [Acidimicrobiia bacterium]